MSKKKIRNAVINDRDTGENHIFYRRFNQGIYYLVGGIEYSPSTLIRLEDFPAEKFDEKLECVLQKIKDAGTRYMEEYNLDPWIIRKMIRDLTPRLRFCA